MDSSWIGIKGLRKNQDYTIQGTIATSYENIHYIGLFDGHGTDIVINYIRGISKEQWKSIIISQNPIFILHELLQSFDTDGSGSTCIIVKIYKNYIQSFSVGDSTIIIFQNNNIVYRNTPHNTLNPKENDRLSVRLVNNYISLVPTRSQTLSIYNNNEINLKYGTYIKFGRTYLALSQALGHNNITGIDPEICRTNYEPGDKIRVFVCSDGITDMLSNKESMTYNNDMHDILTLSGSDILTKIENRWKQEWIFNWSSIYPSVKMHIKPTDYDDISVALWDKS